MACSRRCCSRRALNGESSSPISGTRCCAWWKMSGMVEANHLVRGMMLGASTRLQMVVGHCWTCLAD